MSRGYKRTAISPRTEPEAMAASEAPQPTAAVAPAPRDEKYLGSPDNPRSVLGFEKENGSRKAERGGAFDKDGNFLFSQQGSKKSVRFTDDQISQMIEAKDAVLTHNHPGYGASFSGADIFFFVKTGLGEIRATGREYTYSLRDPNGVREAKYWDKSQGIGGIILRPNGRPQEYARTEPFKDRKSFDKKFYSLVSDDEKRQMLEKIKQENPMPPSIARDAESVWLTHTIFRKWNHDVSDLRVTRMMKELGFEYRRIENKV